MDNMQLFTDINDFIFMGLAFVLYGYFFIITIGSIVELNNNRDEEISNPILKLAYKIIFLLTNKKDEYDFEDAQFSDVIENGSLWLAFVIISLSLLLLVSLLLVLYLVLIKFFAPIFQ